MSDLNKVDTLVKASMLTYPSIFPSRMDVLAHIFMVNGTGYYFDSETGEFTTGDDVEVPDKIARENYDNSRHEVIESIRLRRAFDNHLRDFVEANIDAVCRKNVDDMTRDSVTMLSKTFYEQNGVLANLEKYLDNGNSPESVHEDWRKALKEFCRWFMQKCSGDLLVNDEGNKPQSKDKELLAAYNMCDRLQAKIRTQEDRQLASQRSDIARDILKRIKQKEQDSKNGK